MDVELRKAMPPEILWHGTSEKYVDSILNQGLISKSRLYVHLSKDYDTAFKVGTRHGKTIVFKVYAQKMIQSHYDFFLSKNGVWLTKHVPCEYIEKTAF